MATVQAIHFARNAVSNTVPAVDGVGSLASTVEAALPILPGGAGLAPPSPHTRARPGARG
ncbi:MAG TPA: hypothetical protein VE673_15245 [Pseudonocardiaceae bacterium]|nr:hypothetical protein [Pseudonocardiaceae bacterium]